MPAWSLRVRWTFHRDPQAFSFAYTEAISGSARMALNVKPYVQWSNMEKVTEPCFRGLPFSSRADGTAVVSDSDLGPRQGPKAGRAKRNSDYKQRCPLDTCPNAPTGT